MDKINLSCSEFFVTPYGDVECRQNGVIKTLSMEGPANTEIVNELISYMQTFHLEAYEALAAHYIKLKPNITAYRYIIVSRFIRCNMGEYDSMNDDIDNNGMLNFEEVRCPLRGECALEHVCCKPAFTTSLSVRELEVLKLIVLHYTAREIADMLYLSEHTINNHRRNIHIKTETRTVAELVTYCNKFKIK